MAAAASPRVTLCPPMSARGAMTVKPTFGRQQMLPVHMPEGAYGISFADYNFMQTQNHGGVRGRILQTPEWALNPADVRRVLLHYLEQRAFGCSKQREKNEGLDERTRLERVFLKMRAEILMLTTRTDRLCAKYVVETNSSRKATLGRVITGLDRQIILASRPDVFFDLIRLYYSLGLTSVGISEELNGALTPWGARQVIYRLNQTARELGYDVPANKRRRCNGLTAAE
jgi:hypothetical protein